MSVLKTLLYSIMFVIMFLLIGISGAMTYESFYESDQNLFTMIDKSGGNLGKFSVYAFSIM